MNIGMLSELADDPITIVTSVYSCMIANIDFVVGGVQSVKRETSKGTLSTFSKCGLIFSIPLGSLAFQTKI